MAIEKTHVRELAGSDHFMQTVRVRLRDRAGPDRNVLAEYSVPLVLARDQALRVGEEVTLARTQGPTGPTYYIADRYRLTSLAAIFALFALAVVWFSRTRGLMSIVGLGVSILVLARFVVPRILAGQNPLAVSLLAALGIASTSIYMAHGFSRRTSIALAGTLATLGIAATLAIAFVRVTGLSGMGSEEALTLHIGSMESLNLRGLLLAESFWGRWACSTTSRRPRPPLSKRSAGRTRV